MDNFEVSFEFNWNNIYLLSAFISQHITFKCTYPFLENFVCVYVDTNYTKAAAKEPIWIASCSHDSELHYLKQIGKTILLNHHIHESQYFPATQPSWYRPYKLLCQSLLKVHFWNLVSRKHPWSIPSSCAELHVVPRQQVGHACNS